MKKQLLFCLLLVCGSVFAQPRINENFVQQPLAEVLLLLEQKYDLKISYDPELIEGIKITREIVNLTPKQAFDEILLYTELSFDEIRTNYFSIFPSNTIWKIEGKIKGPEGEAVPYAKIRIKGTYKGVFADMDGLFRLEYRSDQAPYLEISSLGFKTYTVSMADLEETSTIELKVDAVEFETVTVEYLTEGIRVSEDISTIQIRPGKLGSVPGTTEPDIFQLVQSIPGINSASSTVSQIQIRGGTADQNHLIWEGIPIYHPGHFNGMISSINPNIIDKTELHRGVYDPYFGGKASGLILLSSIDHIPKKTEVGVGVNMMQADAYIKAPLSSKFALLVSGRRSYVDFWRSPTYLRYSDRVYQETEIQNTGSYTEEPQFSGDPFEQTDITNDFFYYDLNGKLLFEPAKGHLITFSSLYTGNKLDYNSVFQTDEEIITNYIASTNFGNSLRYSGKWNDKFKTSLVLSHASYLYDFTNRLQFGPEEEDEDPEVEELAKDNSLDHYGVKIRGDYKLNESHSLSSGYQLFYQEVAYNLSAKFDDDSISETGGSAAFTNAFHLNHTFKTRKFLSNIGARLSHFSTTQDLYIEPRVYLQYRFNDWLTSNVGFGIQNQFVSQVDDLEEAGLGLTNRVWVMTDNEDVSAVRSQTFNAGLVLNSGGWQVSADAYVKNLTGIVNFSDNAAISSGFLRGDARAVGIDFLIRKRWKNYRTWMSYSLSNVDYFFPEFAELEFPAPFNQPHVFKWVNTLSWRQFEFSTSFKIASGKPYTSIIGVEEIEPEDPEDDEISYELLYGVPNNQRLPLFHQLDVTVFYNFPKDPDKNWKGKVGVSCFNIYNQRNFLSRTYDLEVIEDEDTEEISFETYAVDKFYLFITPNAVIRFQF